MAAMSSRINHWPPRELIRHRCVLYTDRTEGRRFGCCVMFGDEMAFRAKAVEARDAAGSVKSAAAAAELLLIAAAYERLAHWVLTHSDYDDEIDVRSDTPRPLKSD